MMIGRSVNATGCLSHFQNGPSVNIPANKMIIPAPKEGRPPTRQRNTNYRVKRLLDHSPVGAKPQDGSLEKHYIIGFCRPDNGRGSSIFPEVFIIAR